MAKSGITLTTPHDSTCRALDFRAAKDLGEIQIMGTPSGDSCIWDTLKSATFDK